jgi:integrase
MQQENDAITDSPETVAAVAIARGQSHFGPDRDLATINEGDADAFKLWLMGRNLSATTVHKRLQFARMFFRAAHRRKLCPSNPFEDVKSKAISRPERQQFVTRETINRVLDACDPDWRLIVKLSRFAALRCPSETFSLQWQDIDWDKMRMTIRSPKTEHHEGRASRSCPIFTEIQSELRAAYERAPERAVFVLESFRSRAMQKGHWRNANLRTQFERIIRRAGVEPWPRLFHQLRASCESELVRRFPLSTVVKWVGHDISIAMKHYLSVTDDDFVSAATAPDAMQEAVRTAANNPGQPTTNGEPPVEDSPCLTPVGRY